jgi:putative ABC transport system permease protein
MQLITLSPFDLLGAALLVLALALLSWRLHLQIGRRMLVAAARATLQLLLLGLILKQLFAQSDPLPIMAITLVMLAVAGWEVRARQRRRFSGAWGYGVGTLSMFLSSFTLAWFATRILLQTDPWYLPQYLIPLLGMLLGNTMSGIAVALDQLTRATWDQRSRIEGRLLLGESGREAIADVRNDALRAGLIPIINAMTTAGIVSLPGMMTGQILGGTPPFEAAKYQLLILLLIAAGTGLGSVTAVWMGARRLFDERDRLRLDRLSN